MAKTPEWSIGEDFYSFPDEMRKQMLREHPERIGMVLSVFRRDWCLTNEELLEELESGRLLAVGEYPADLFVTVDSIRKWINNPKTNTWKFQRFVLYRALLNGNIKMCVETRIKKKLLRLNIPMALLRATREQLSRYVARSLNYKREVEIEYMARLSEEADLRNRPKLAGRLLLKESGLMIDGDGVRKEFPNFKA